MLKDHMRVLSDKELLIPKIEFVVLINNPKSITKDILIPQDKTSSSVKFKLFNLNIFEIKMPGNNVSKIKESICLKNGIFEYRGEYIDIFVINTNIKVNIKNLLEVIFLYDIIITCNPCNS
jgi:hypothetical protein